MKRRAVVGALAASGLGLSSGCLSRAREATTCAPSSRFGVLIENHRESPVSVPVEIETGLLGRDVFSTTFDVPAATYSSGQTYHPEVVYESEVLANLRSYTVSVRDDGETATYSWRVRCRHLYISIDDVGIGFTTISPERWDLVTADH